MEKKFKQNTVYVKHGVCIEMSPEKLFPATKYFSVPLIHCSYFCLEQPSVTFLSILFFAFIYFAFQWFGPLNALFMESSKSVYFECKQVAYN